MTAYPDFRKCKVVVVGDIMLDRYYWGDVSRISPEAPVQVVRVKEKTSTLGGAGNVTLNLSGLKCEVNLIGIRGNDSPGNFLMNLLTEKNIEHQLIIAPNQPTTTKTRIIGQGQQLLRLDEEEPQELPEDVNRQLLDSFFDCVDNINAVILSDYGKGVFSSNVAEQIIRFCRTNKIPVFIDPKGKTWNRYHGATCITPNEAEFRSIAPFPKGDAMIMGHQAKTIIKRYELEYIMVTRGASGISLFSQMLPTVHIPTKAQEVYDVSGAGDTVIATLAAGYGCGLTMVEAAELANAAAGIVVGKVGTQPINERELKRAVSDDIYIGVEKIVSRHEAKVTISQWRNDNKKIVFTNGCFDILHIGHIKLLNAAASKGDKLVVGLNSDASVGRLKGQPRPITRQEERATLLSSINCVDLIVIFEEDTPIELIKTFEPDILVKGGDYTPDTVVGRDVVESRGGKVVIIPLVDGASTTSVINQLKSVSNQ